MKEKLIMGMQRRVFIGLDFMVDQCIAEEIIHLNNDLGIQTFYCCCGHGERRNAFIMTKTDHYKEMLEMGYKKKKPIIIHKVYRQYPSGRRYDHECERITFLPLSKCNGACKKKGGERSGKDVQDHRDESLQGDGLRGNKGRQRQSGDGPPCNHARKNRLLTLAGDGISPSPAPSGNMNITERPGWAKPLPHSLSPMPNLPSQDVLLMGTRGFDF